jgi:uncharacterized protein
MQPTQEKERIISIDALRGMALLGIFLVNMISFHSPYFYYDPYQWWGEGKEQTTYRIIDFFFQASVYPLFALLFGYGLGILQRRAIHKGENFYFMAIKKLFILLVIGIIHAFVIWSGDILITYAIIGLMLLVFMQMSGKTLVLLGSTFFLIPTMFLSIFTTLIAISHTGDTTYWTNIEGLQDAITAYSEGSFIEIFKQRFHDWYLVNQLSNWPMIALSIWPMMALGAGASKLQVVEKMRQYKNRFILVGSTALLLGAFFKIIPFLFTPHYPYTYIQDSLGGPLLAVFYASSGLLLFSQKWIQKWIHPLALAGRMSMTIYLLESIIGTMIFYHYGLDLYGKMSLTTSSWLAVGIYIILVILAEFWFGKYKYGPIEKLWRIGTYGIKLGGDRK